MNTHDPNDASASSAQRALAQRVGFRLGVASAIGIVVALVVLPLRHEVAFAIMAGWLALAVVFSIWTWALVARMDEHAAARHAKEEDPSVTGAHVIVLIGTVASLAGVGFLLVAGNHKNSAGAIEALLGALSVIASWFLVHLTYIMRYAREYYGDGPGARGVEFEGGEPDYYDFAYLSFDLGMTYQVSDTNLKNRQMRRIVLGHCLLSYLLGVGVVATSINLVVSLASGAN